MHQATRDLTKAALEEHEAAYELLHDSRLTLNPNDFPDFCDSDVLDLWASIRPPPQEKVDPIHPVSQITIVTDDSIIPEGLDPETMQKLRYLQLNVKEPNLRASVTLTPARSHAMRQL